MKKVLFTLACLLMTLGMAAQKKDHGRKEFSPEEYRQKMQEYITKEANLTANEQQKFFPLLTEMMDAQRKLMDQERELMRSGKNAKTEAEFEQIVTKTTELQVENRKIEVAYYKKFAKVLTWEKIYKARMAITKFNMRALRNFAPKKGDGKWKKRGEHKKEDANTAAKHKKHKKQKKNALA